MNRDDAQAIRRALDELQQAAQAMAQHMQQQQPAGAGAGAAASGNGRNGQGGERKDDIIDAEFEVKK
jgi:hypothetical protein